MAEKHSHTVPGGRGYWLTEKLWVAASELAARPVKLSEIKAFDHDCWFGRHRVPTIKAIAEHAKRIQAADLSYPIILAADGRLMDGGHRLARAYLEGRTEVQAVQFERGPEPDWIEPAQPR
jgi:hypothetical protein